MRSALQSPLSGIPSPFGRRRGDFAQFDADAADYISRVETADGQALEPEVKTAINDFVVGCKVDATWAALKASCIMAGARTLAGALVPLVGTSPTNNNFVSADYDRVTGLKGNGSTKYLNTNRAGNADPQDNQHLAVFLSETGSDGKPILGNDYLADGASLIYHRGTDENLFKSRSSSLGAGGIVSVGFIALSRNNSANFKAALGTTDTTYSIASQSPLSDNITFFRALGDATNAQFYNGRSQFYSVGESLNLPALRARTSALMAAIEDALT